MVLIRSHCFAFAGLCLLVLVPCYWLPRIVSSDLGSHVYNAWLAVRIAEGQVSGIRIAGQWNNVLFDWMLAALLPLVGGDWAQRVAVSAAVLVFAFGSTMLVVATGRRIPWHVLPILAMLAYGFVFHIGFFNFYLSSGFCLAALALSWSGLKSAKAAARGANGTANPPSPAARLSVLRAFLDSAQGPARATNWAGTRRPGPRRGSVVRVFLESRTLQVFLLVALGVLSHPLPVVWLAAVGGFIALARRIDARNRHMLTLGVFVALVGIAWLLTRLFTSNWQPVQLYLWSGADQAVVHGDAYLRWGLAWFGWGLLLFAVLLFTAGWSTVLQSPLFHVILLQAVALVFIPSQMQLPGFLAHFSFFAERMSLLQGVLVCALLARAPVNAWTILPGVVLGLSYFYCLRADDGVVARFEDRVAAVTATFSDLPRVVAGLCTPARRLNYGTHILDRACVGKCYSYGNYEPASGQFRLRAQSGNSYVVSDIGRAYAFEFGGAEIVRQDLPLLRVEGVLGGEVTVRSLREGERIGSPCPSR